MLRQTSIGLTKSLWHDDAWYFESYWRRGEVEAGKEGDQEDERKRVLCGLIHRGALRAQILNAGTTCTGYIIRPQTS